MNHISEPVLNDYVDGLLDAAESAAITAHLETCDACRREAHALGGILADLQALPRSIEPARDLRPGIAERLAQTERPVVRRAYARWLPLSAAAVLLIATSSLLTRWLVLRSVTQDARPVASAPIVPSTTAPSAQLASFQREEQRYVSEATRLQRALEQQQSRLSPETQTIVQRNVAIIDRAIAESRAALAHDPANRDLTRLVLSAYQQKIALLRGAGAMGT